MSKLPDQTFRDTIGTIDEEGNRKYILPKKPSGRFYDYRKWVSYFLLLVLVANPFIKVNGNQFMMFNVLERRFIIFGFPFWPQDFYLFVIFMVVGVVFVIFFTVIFGRIFCGWICPQTIFMEFVFRQIEYLIEGTAAAQRRLNNQALNFEKLWKKSLKHFIFFLIAIVTSTTFLAYMIGIDSIFSFLKEGPIDNLSGYLGLLIFSGVFYFVFAFFREQVCTIACPYGRLQGVLVDKKSIIVGYDYKRGEPRGPINKKGEIEKGDCIDCKACVVVCPTGIDIRNGTQLECINCTACIDACDAVMDRVKKPRGLIRYDSELGIETGHHSIFNTRSIAYSIVLVLLMFFVGYLFMLRGDFESTILRARGSLFQNYGSDSLSNIYNYNLVNKSSETLKIEYILESHNGRIQHIQENVPVEVGEVGKGTFLVIISKDQLLSSNTPVVFGLYKDGILVDTYTSSFVGPSALDRK
ncbi:MAG: cytochrome c oxidase accessory protein CcoG [Bacteroidetes bacterium]|nr:cytochrome c oxidase accessory protein CcoG [Bacteroidota bacterium]